MLAQPTYVLTVCRLTTYRHWARPEHSVSLAQVKPTSIQLETLHGLDRAAGDAILLTPGSSMLRYAIPQRQPRRGGIFRGCSR